MYTYRQIFGVFSLHVEIADKIAVCNLNYNNISRVFLITKYFAILHFTSAFITQSYLVPKWLLAVNYFSKKSSISDVGLGSKYVSPVALFF